MIAGALVVVLAAGAASTPSGAAADALATIAIDVLDVQKAPATVDDPQWAKAARAKVAVAPQHTVRLLDKHANELRDRGAGQVSVSALKDASTLALLVEWDDATEDRADGEETAAFGDAAAVQLPLRYGAGVRLPYIGMGDDEQAVLVYHQRATSRRNGAQTVKGSAGREAIARGFGSLTRNNLGGVRMEMSYDAAAKRWRALFLRALDVDGSSLRAGLVPVAIAVWDGAAYERGGNKRLSGWHVLRGSGARDAAYVDELSWGRRPGDLGDPVRGKQLASGVCVACHRFADKRFALEGLAPELDAAGVIMAPSYARSSILEPSLVIVPPPNPNRHYDKGAAPDQNGAFPNNAQLGWSSVVDGKKVSRMPPLPLPEQDVKDIVAYLMTLGVADRAPALQEDKR